MKIVYVIDSLFNKGGAERIISAKMQFLAEKYGHEVYIITCYQNPIAHPNAYPLSDKVEQVNLEVPYFSQYKVGYPKRIWVKWSLYRRLKKDLTAKVQELDPDVLIGLSYFNADLVCGIKCRAVKIVESHEARFFSMMGHGEQPLYYRIYMRRYLPYYHRRIEHRADAVVALTNGDAYEWRKARRVEVIPNFSVMPVSSMSSCNVKRILAIGRLEWQKGLDRLIEIWKLVSGHHPDWQLDIFGSGSLHNKLNTMIKEAGLTTVRILPFVSDISREYASSSVVVLTSHFEGFSLVLLEALRHGVPCVSFDCPFGPSDVLADGECGFLVENGNVALFAEKLCMLIENESLRQQFGAAAVERAKIFNPDKIMEQWRLLFEDLVGQKSNG